MAESKAGAYLAFFLAGAAAGALVALLLAPRSGKDTRRYLSRTAGEGRDIVAAKGRKARRRAQRTLDKGKDWATSLVH